MAINWMRLYVTRPKTMRSFVMVWIPIILMVCLLFWLSHKNTDKSTAILDASTSSSNTQYDDVSTSSTNYQSDEIALYSNPTIIPTNLNMVYFGNSILMVNNCPALIKKMIVTAKDSEITINQESCLAGGATLSTLWSATCSTILNNFVSLFSDDDEDDSVPLLHGSHDWDYMILQDQTQAPARQYYRSISADALRKHYGPLSLLRNQTSTKKLYTIPIVIQTAAYRKPGVMDSDDLGDFYQFTNLLAEGAKEYAKVLNQVLLDNLRVGKNGAELSKEQHDKNNQFILRYGARVAPVGEGYRLIHDKEPTLWNKLYSSDHYHPSPYGTWLQACIVFITCFRQVPPDYDVNWNLGIGMEDAITLRSAACEITRFNC